jgi:hypothetical protein
VKFLRSQPVRAGQNVSHRCTRLMITFSYNLSNNLESFVTLDTALCTNAIDLQDEIELLNQVVENLMIAVNFRGREKIRLLAPEKRTLISSLLFYAQNSITTLTMIGLKI